MLVSLIAPRRRTLGLTPMIDVVFLLLVFFMLAARFGVTEALPVTLAAGGGDAYSGPPRLVTVLPGALRVNGVETTDLVARLTPLMGRDSDIILVRAREGATVQTLLDAMTTLRAAGWTNLVVAE